jgi:hypothetical protein
MRIILITLLLFSFSIGYANYEFSHSKDLPPLKITYEELYQIIFDIE